MGGVNAIFLVNRHFELQKRSQLSFARTFSHSRKVQPRFFR
jgi:hypothetical protein